MKLNAGNSGSASYLVNGQEDLLSPPFPSIAQGMVSNLEGILWQDLMYTEKAEDELNIKLAQIVDDVSLTRRGVSFVNRCENGLGG